MDWKNYAAKHKWDIAFVLFLAYMIFVPQNPVRIFLTELVGKARTGIEGITLDKDEQVSLDENVWQWTLADDRGNTLRLGDLRGKPVLINFWSVTCPPCVAELPSLAGLYKDYGQKVHFLFVSLDSPGRAQEFLQQRGLDIPVYFRASGTPGVFRTNVIPTTIIIDAGGVMRVKKTGALDWNSSRVKRLLDQWGAQ